MKRIVKFFGSVKLAIVLLMCLAFTSIIGTVIAQKQNPVLYIQHYGEGLFKLFRFMGEVSAFRVEDLKLNKASGRDNLSKRSL